MNKKYRKREREKLEEIYSSSENSLDNMSPFIVGMFPIFELIKLPFVKENKSILSSIILILSAIILILSAIYIFLLRFSHIESNKNAKRGLDIITDNDNYEKYNEKYKEYLFKSTKILNLWYNRIFVCIITIFIINIILLTISIL